ncbi:DUF4158 domain-containing protein, partial [Bacillus cereus]|nr:DUF4158 domain-containing protein [Bacillus cereus]
MTSIERTSYPRFKQNLTGKELKEIYTVTYADNQFAHRVARGTIPVFSLLVMLKSFHRLGYFPRPKDIPSVIIHHIRSSLRILNETEPNFRTKSIYRHQKAIGEHLQVLPFGKDALHIATNAIYKASQVMDNPADLINVSIEELIKERYELPAFSTLDRLARRV